VFKVTRAAAETVLHTFTGGSDGAVPQGGLINVGGTFYGTTTAGGDSTSCEGGCGTVFKVTKDGAETVVYAFKGDNDGASPEAGLIEVGGALDGTTYSLWHHLLRWHGRL
jgi:uncharacterized repeat protein (TIGR03803 family)